MKKLLFILSSLLFAVAAFAQAEVAESPAQKATDELALVYNLNEQQVAEVVKIQERKYRNLAEFEPLKKTDPSLFIQKIRAMQQANDASFKRLLNQEQQALFQQKQSALRMKKAELYKELKDAGASQQEIDKKILELEMESML